MFFSNGNHGALAVPSWPVSINSLEGAIETIDELFEPLEFGLELESRAPKRKETTSPTFPTGKRVKSKLGTPTANVIESNDELNDEELLALSDAFSGESSDSFDEESLMGEDSDDSADDESEFTGEFYGLEDGPDLAGKPKPAGDKKARGNYSCSKCGMAKRGHVCALQPEVPRRRNGLLAVPSTVFAAPATGSAAGSARASVKSSRVAKPSAVRCEAGAGPSDAYDFVRSAAAPKMVCTASQCELEAANTVRELFVEAQGFPESYMSGILCDPSFNLATAKTVTVSKHSKSSYKPRVKSSMGCGPDSMAPSSFLTHQGSFLNPADPLGLMRGAAAGPLALNHLALLMSTFQHGFAQQQGMPHQFPGLMGHMPHQFPGMPGMPGMPGEIDPALASLFFPMAGCMPPQMVRQVSRE